MLSAEKNKVLTQVGPGTPMGDYLRRYWMPIGGATELDQIAIKPMRLFGEDLVLYRDRGGTFGLIDRQCPHRRADLALGFVEEAPGERGVEDNPVVELEVGIAAVTQ